MNCIKYKYTKNSASIEDIYKCLFICDINFIPMLSERVNIKQYSAKLYERALNFEAWCGSELIALVSIYINDEMNYGYISNVNIIAEHSKRGITSQLMKNALKYMTNKNIFVAKLEVHRNNLSAIHLYEKFNFEIIDILNNDFYVMELKIKEDV
jgi:ribosomal-protein-alanine N-acetyltransferase